MTLRTCEFCDNKTALLCGRTDCRDAGYGEPHNDDCPARTTSDMTGCVCARGREVA